MSTLVAVVFDDEATAFAMRAALVKMQKEYLIELGDAVIAVGGSWGTLAEIGFAMRLGRPVVVLEPGWELDGIDRGETPADAVDLALSRVTGEGSGT